MQSQNLFLQTNSELSFEFISNVDDEKNPADFARNNF